MSEVSFKRRSSDESSLSRNAPLRMPFKFGNATLRDLTLVYVLLRVETASGESARGTRSAWMIAALQ